MKTIKFQYTQPRTKILQIGDTEDFLMDSGPGANDQTDPTKDGNSAKEFDIGSWSDANETFGTLEIQQRSVWDDEGI